MAKLTLGDRVASAFVGTVVGAIVGACLSWLLGVYSNTLGPSQVGVNVAKMTGAVVAFFAIIGFAFGPSVGTALGNTISAIFEFERVGDGDVPGWIVVLVLAGVALGVWWVLM
jgi:purine-cytosine permease-like protein